MIGNVAARVATVAAFFLSASLLQAQSDKILDKTYSVSGRPELQVLVDDSSVRAQSCGGCRAVSIHVDTRDMNLSDFRVEQSQNGNQVRFSLKRPEGLHWQKNVRRWPEVTVMMPAESNAALRSGDGAVSLTGVSGKIVLHSGDGAISAADVRGVLEVGTGDGSIALQHVEGSLAATTGDGALHAEGRFTQVDARTGDGSVQVTAEEGSSLSGGLRITTGDGSVNLRVPRSTKADVDLRAGDGSVHCDLPLLVQSSSNNRHVVRGTLNGGGSAIHLTTGDGSVSLSGL